jgi:hypothetical protein
MMPDYKDNSLMKNERRSGGRRFKQIDGANDLNKSNVSP